MYAIKHYEAETVLAVGKTEEEAVISAGETMEEYEGPREGIGLTWAEAIKYDIAAGNLEVIHIDDEMLLKALGKE